MLLPSSFTQVVADTFYDKTVKKLVVTETNTNGWIEKTTTENGTFLANVQFSNLAKIQSEMGLTDQIDVNVTCSTDVTVSVGDLFSYQNVTYSAIAVVPYDSHKQIVGSKWV